jgi:hypothetical protein
MLTSIQLFENYIKTETQAISIEQKNLQNATEFEIEEFKFLVAIEK